MGAWQVNRWAMHRGLLNHEQCLCKFTHMHWRVRGLDTQEWKIFALRERELSPLLSHTNNSKRNIPF